MTVESLVNLYIRKGAYTGGQTFIKGKEYYYYAGDSKKNQRLIKSEEGERIYFTDEEFRKYFKIIMEQKETTERTCNPNMIKLWKYIENLVNNGIYIGCDETEGWTIGDHWGEFPPSTGDSLNEAIENLP